MDLFYSLHVHMGKPGFCTDGTNGRSQVMDALRITGHRPKMDQHIIKIDIPNQSFSFSVDQNAVFSLTQYIIKVYIMYRAHIRFLFPAQDRDGDGLCRSPIDLRFEKPGRNRQILENHIFDTALIPQLHGNAPIRTGDHTVFHQNIAEKRLALTTKFDSGTGGHQCAVADRDILTGSILHGGGCIFEHNMALLASYMVEKADDESLEKYLAERVFIKAKSTTIAPDKSDVAGFNAYIAQYRKLLEVERKAVEVV